MTSIFEKLKKRIQERANEIVKLSSDLDNMKARRQQMESEINVAIDGNDTSLAERLVNQQRDLDVKIEVLERTITRKSTTDLNRAEIIEAANKETADYQKRIDQAQETVISAKKAYYSKLIDLATLVNEAWDARTSLCSLIDGIEDPNTYNVQTKEFEGVRAAIKWDKTDNDFLKEINPNAVAILNNATANRTNTWVGRPEVKSDPGVRINKY